MQLHKIQSIEEGDPLLAKLRVFRDPEGSVFIAAEAVNGLAQIIEFEHDGASRLLYEADDPDGDVPLEFNDFGRALARGYVSARQLRAVVRFQEDVSVGDDGEIELEIAEWDGKLATAKKLAEDGVGDLIHAFDLGRAS